MKTNVTLQNLIDIGIYGPLDLYKDTGTDTILLQDVFTAETVKQRYPELLNCEVTHIAAATTPTTHEAKVVICIDATTR